MDSSVTVRFQTFGCKVNTYDTGLLQKRFAQNGFSMADKGFLTRDSRHVYVLNTCAVTAEATREAVRTVRKIKRDDPSSVVVVTGCAAQVDTGAFENLGGVDLVVANSHKGQLEDLIHRLLRGELTERVFKSNIFKKDDLEAGGGEEAEHTRAFVKIQDGCNSFCTFCVIPFARGKSRSLTVDSLCDRISRLVGDGVREVVLTGVHIGDYEYGLENLVEAVLARTRVERVRLTSLEPIELSERLLDLYSDRRMCPHFHMSIQSASTPVLRGMKRKYTAEDVEHSLQWIARQVPGAFVGMDVIAGFPGEGEAEFLETYERLANLPWTRLHVFPYSERPGTYAVRMDGKNERGVIHRRADRLRGLSRERLAASAAAQIGSKKSVLVLRDGSGLSRDYWRVRFGSARSGDLGADKGAEKSGDGAGNSVGLGADKFGDAFANKNLHSQPIAPSRFSSPTINTEINITIAATIPSRNGEFELVGL